MCETFTHTQSEGFASVKWFTHGQSEGFASVKCLTHGQSEGFASVKCLTHGQSERFATFLPQLSITMQTAEDIIYTEVSHQHSDECA